MSILDTKIEFLKGVGPKRAVLLNQEFSIFNFYDLLTFFPFRYIDRSKYYRVNQIRTFDTDIQIIGFVKAKREVGVGKKRRLIVSFLDGTGTVSLIFFKRIKWLNSYVQINQKYLIFGRPKKYAGDISFVHPEMELLGNNTKRKKYTLYPVYHTTEKLTKLGLNSKGISKLTEELLLTVKHGLSENLSESIVHKYCFLNRKDSFLEIHFPSNNNNLTSAISRFKFEELFFLQLTLLKQKSLRCQQVKSYVFKKVGYNFNTFYNKCLDFNLTNAQKRVISEIRNDMLTGFQMNRLLQGDVGSGKTVVAIMIMLLACDNNYQTCLMAPTEILANQHYNNIMKFSNVLGLNVALLTSKTNTAEKSNILSDLKANLINMIIGTHALIQDNVVFANLGLVVIDEQHKFGVSQRAKLWKNQNASPHVLVMTATPIPRTLAMTAYGDLDVSVIDELPPSRKEVKTVHKYDKEINEVFKFIYKELQKKRQVYIVYPLIEESKVLDYKNLLDGYQNIQKIFGEKGFCISMIHGKLDKETKELEMNRFIKNQTQILVATTVIEVGVDVPNATTMVIFNAEKFGLSQLHQLRGRVGRGAQSSYCYLITSNKLTKSAKTRLKAMIESNDGFHISEIDLKLRGPGDILGTRQSGLLNLKISNLIQDQDILTTARKEAQVLLNYDFNFSNIDNIGIRKFFLKYHQELLKWGTVS